MSDLNKTRKTGALVLYMIAMLGLPLSSLIISKSTPLLGGVDPYARLLIADCVYYVPFVGLPVYLYARRDQEKQLSRQTDSIGILPIILLAVTSFVVFILCNNITVICAIPFQKIGLNIYASTLPHPGNSKELVLYVISAAAIPAVFEELLFRGVLLSAFEDIGTQRAIRLSALLFAIMHGNAIGFAAEYIAGILLAEICIYCRSFYASMIFHMMYNTVTIIMDYTTASEGGGDLWASLGFGGFFALLFNTALFTVCTAILLSIFEMRAKKNGIEPVPAEGKIKLPTIGIICLIVAGAVSVFLYISDIAAMHM